MHGILARRRIGPRLSLGFGAVLGLLVVTAVVAGAGLFASLTSFQEYRRFTGTVIDLLEGERDLLATHVVMKDLYLARDTAIASTIEERLANVSREVAEARGGIVEPERLGQLDRIAQDLADYDVNYVEMHALVEAYHGVNAFLDEHGMRVDAAMAELALALETSANAGAQYHLGNARFAFSDARNGVLRFVLAQGESGTEQIERRLAEARSEIDVMRTILIGPSRHAAQALLAEIQEYDAYAGQLIDLLRDTNVVVAALDTTGRNIAGGAEALALAYVAELDEIGPRTASVAWTALLTGIAAALASLVVGVVLSRLLARSLTRPLSEMTGAMERLSQGELSTSVPCLENVDETGDMAKALQVFKENAVERQKLETAQAERVEKMDRAIKRFDAEVNQALAAVDGASTQLGDSATTMVAAAGQASSNVQSVATAAEEMSASVAEISSQTGTSRNVAGEAVKAVTTASRVVDELAATAQQITGIVDLISDIADQTNLLALNATIEAARAGEAGKGFAVVAHEVKTLASRTGQATADIAQKVQGIAHGSEEAVKMIAQVTEVMQRIDEIATAIAGAIEEQSAVTTSIAQNAQEAAQGTDSVVVTIRGRDDGQGAGDDASVIGAARSLGEQSAVLKQRVQAFLDDIRAA